MLLKENPEQWLWLFISILTAWRVTTLLCYEAGPFNLMSKIRLVFYKLNLGSLIDCFHCAAIWVSLLIALGLYKISIATVFLIFAISAGASLIEKIINSISQLKETSHENE